MAVFEQRFGMSRIEFYEDAASLHERHAAHARANGYEAIARRAEERAARARERARRLREGSARI